MLLSSICQSQSALCCASWRPTHPCPGKGVWERAPTFKGTQVPVTQRVGHPQKACMLGGKFAKERCAHAPAAATAGVVGPCDGAAALCMHKAAANTSTQATTRQAHSSTVQHGRSAEWWVPSARLIDSAPDTRHTLQNSHRASAWRPLCWIHMQAHARPTIAAKGNQ